MLALPAILLVIWLSGRATTVTPTAEVRIEAAKVATARSQVIEKATAAGAVPTDEATDFDGGGSSDLRFRVPVAKLQGVLGAVRQVDGVVGQDVDIDRAVAGATTVESELDGLSTCYASLTDEIGHGDVTKRLQQCRERIDAATAVVRDTPGAGQNVQLRVVVNERSTTNPALIVGVIALTIALGTLIVMSLRGRDGGEVVDVTDGRRDLTFEELYHRRN